MDTELPAELASHVSEGCGEAGKQWLRELPTIIADLERHWSITVDSPFPGIEFNYVAPATDGEGRPVVLKIAPPWTPVEIFGEAEYLRVKGGARCVKLIAVHEERKAILIERVVPGEPLFKTFAGREDNAIKPAIDVLSAVIGPVPVDASVSVSLDDWFDRFRRYSETDFPADYGAKALKLYDDLSAKPGGNLYLHGDFHPGNVVTSSENGFIIIDPKGISGHIGYEISVFLNNFHWWQEKKPDVRDSLDRAVTAFSNAFKISELELRQWAYAGMVIGAWWNYTDMPALYDGGVVKADVWGV
jgi:streptomycin 6-kinase